MATEFTKLVFKEKNLFAQWPPEGTKPKYMIFFGKRTESHRTKSHKTPRTKSHRIKSHNLYFCMLGRTESHNMYTLIHVCIILLCIVLNTDRDIVSGSFCCFKLYYRLSYQLAVWYMLFLKYSLFKTSSLLQDEEQ